MRRWSSAGCAPSANPHCGSVRIDETYIKIRGQWRYLYRAIDKHGTPVDFLLTAKRDLEAAKRFFRKMLKGQPLLAPDRIGTDRAGPYPAIAAARKDGLLAARAAALRQQTSAAGDRERSLSGQEEHALDRRLSILPHGTTDDPGVRSHAVAA
jgi:transposase-like protein